MMMTIAMKTIMLVIVRKPSHTPNPPSDDTITNAITSNISLSRWFHLEFLLFLITRNAIVCAASLLTLI